MDESTKTSQLVRDIIAIYEAESKKQVIKYLQENYWHKEKTEKENGDVIYADLVEVEKCLNQAKYAVQNYPILKAVEWIEVANAGAEILRAVITEENMRR